MRQLTPLRLVVAALLLVAILAAGYLLLRPVTPAQAGAAPDFRLPTTAGGQVALSSYRGHPVLLNFLATWCTTCKGELSVIARARLKHPNLVTLLVDERETASQVRSFLRSLHVFLPALLDTDGTVAARYAIAGQPETVWIAPSGRIRAVTRGPIDAWIIDSRYQQLESKI
jgi:cytochrome c biogenesis protein CcmG, thiol:disulfide interchange protein DsbE